MVKILLVVYSSSSSSEEKMMDVVEWTVKGLVVFRVAMDVAETD